MMIRDYHLDPSTRAQPTRRGSALMLTMTIVILLAAMSMTLTQLTVSRFQDQQRRQDEVRLLAAAETAANEAMEWMHAHPDRLKVLAETPKYPNPNAIITPINTMQDEFDRVMALPIYSTTSPGLRNYVDSATETGTNAIYPSFKNHTTGIDIPEADLKGQTTSVRNNCQVSCRIVCLHQTETAAAGYTHYPPHTWPDGHEKFLVFATAVQGDLALDPNSYRRRRVEAVVSTTSQEVFQQGMFAYSGYIFGGNAHTDSYNGTATAYSAATSTHHGTIYSGAGITLSGSYSIDGTPATVPNATLNRPDMTYAPPAGGIILGSVAGARTLDAPGVAGVETVYKATSITAPLTITGTGTVIIYLDGPLDTDSIRFGPGSTAKLIIRQNNYIGGATSQFRLNGGAQIGDLGTAIMGSTAASPGCTGVGPDATRFEFISNYTGTMNFNGNGKFSGVIYAPFAGLNLGGTFDYFGAMIMDNFTSRVNGNFGFHYDDRLNNLSLPLNPQLSASGWNVAMVGLSKN